MDLDAFEAWFLRRGGAQGSLKQYRSHLSRPRDRLTSKKLSPNTRRVCLGAWRAWAKFTKDTALAEELADVRMPPAARVRVQNPLPPKIFAAFRREVATGAREYLEPAMRAELGIMAGRGLRRGDVLRMRRDRIDEALKRGTLSYLAKGEKWIEIGVLPTYRPYLELLAKQPNDWETVVDLFEAPQEKVEKEIAIAVRQVAWQIDRGDLSVDDFRPHVLRRSYAVAFYEACGKDPMALTKHMGWGSVAVAMGYVDHSRREELDAVAGTMFEEEDD